MSLEKRKNRVGRVVSDKMDKTVIVAVQRQRNHYLYKKPQRMTSKFYAHDGRNECSVGDLVKIEECRPLSALKRCNTIAKQIPMNCSKKYRIALAFSEYSIFMEVSLF